MSPVGGGWERRVGGRGLGWEAGSGRLAVGWAGLGEEKAGGLGGKAGFSLLLADWALASPTMSECKCPTQPKCGKL